MDESAHAMRRSSPRGRGSLLGLETAMFARRRGPRLALAAGIALVALIDWRGDWLHLHGSADRTAYAVWLVVNAVTILPIVVGVLAAGRGRREGGEGAELQGTAVVSPLRSAAARYLGAVGPCLSAGAALTVVMALLALGKVGGDGALTTLAASAAILLPATLVAAALGLALAALLPVRLAQAAFAAVWVWALLGGVRGLPSIGRTPLDPTVAYARQVLFGTDAMMSDAPFHPAPGGAMLALNLALLGLAILASIALVARRERPL
jgi:hypothetical protein